MDNSWENFEPAPLEFMHKTMHELFHEYRINHFGKDVMSIPMDGIFINNIIAEAKKRTYGKYPKQVSDKAILKTDL